MPVTRMCKDCGKSIIIFSTLQNRCAACMTIIFKPIRKVGKRTTLYNTWRDTVAKPYLDARYGRVCAMKGCDNTRVDVDHIQGRGGHPDKKMDVHNIQYLCRYHHRLKTDNKELHDE